MLSKVINTKMQSKSSISGSKGIGFLTSVNQSQLSALLLAAHSLFHLEEYDDCIALLDPLISVEDDMSYIDVLNNLKTVLPNQPNEINVMAGNSLLVHYSINKHFNKILILYV
jgi:hypothetical protein